MNQLEKEHKSEMIHVKMKKEHLMHDIEKEKLFEEALKERNETEQRKRERILIQQEKAKRKRESRSSHGVSDFHAFQSNRSQSAPVNKFFRICILNKKFQMREARSLAVLKRLTLTEVDQMMQRGLYAPKRSESEIDFLSTERTMVGEEMNEQEEAPENEIVTERGKSQVRFIEEPKVIDLSTPAGATTPIPVEPIKSALKKSAKEISN